MKNSNFVVCQFLKQLIFCKITFFERSDLMFNINLVFRLEINPEFILWLNNEYNKICHIFWLLRPSIKWWLKIPKNALNMFIRSQKSIEFQLIHHEILQPSARYLTHSQKIFWYVLHVCSIESHKKLGVFFLNKPCLEMIELALRAPSRNAQFTS